MKRPPPDISFHECVGRIAALSQTLDLIGAPRAADVPLTLATVEAMRRRLGSTISRMTLLQREDLREKVVQLVSDKKLQSSLTGEMSEAAQLFEAKTFRQLIAFLQPHMLLT